MIANVIAEGNVSQDDWPHLRIGSAFIARSHSLDHLNKGIVRQVSTRAATGPEAEGDLVLHPRTDSPVPEKMRIKTLPSLEGNVAGRVSRLLIRI